jgi:protein-disulfide isomerase
MRVLPADRWDAGRVDRKDRNMDLTRRQILRYGAISAVALGQISTFDQALAAEALPPPLLGKATAPKRLVVWGSYTCPFTAQLLGILFKIQRDMPDVVSVEWHHFPTHAPDPALHVAGLGFTGNHFWNFTLRVLSAVLTANGNWEKLTDEMLLEFAKAEGGSEATLKAAYADKAKWAAVREDLVAGQLLGVTVTPGLFHNGYFLTPEGLPLDHAGFDKSLRAMLQAG